ncbi:venom carboxylesterase-6-like isoform X2 [Pieris brassicae]|uniref:venom carboxylesterase-6-like isoform X2 n=1 Tax=Pieris brassicae TaxID=7116 RepID=UPI001E6606EA|nr:venom carboxylesterase-6-like isoform X2 [Pieris brassicae]
MFKTLIKLILINFAVGVLVQVKNGKLKGILGKSVNGRDYASFQGIPYAAPPTGKYRFVEAIEMPPWSGVWHADKPLSRCLQFDPFIGSVTGSEDCLFLNVYTPSLNRSAKLPVLVFIHGGAFMFGTGNIYGPQRIMDWNMVVVTINYRLGPLGFLSTGDNVVPGNAGLKDQNLALIWVKNNIRYFGGNTDNIVLFGNSAGSSSVHYHLLSRRSRDKFHRGIMSSGSALAPWAQQTKPDKNARTLAELVGCPSDNNVEMVKCFRSRPADVIVSAQGDMLGWRAQLFTPFTPVVEPECSHAFIDRHPYLGTQEGSFQKLPLLITTTSEEGLYPAAIFQSNATLLPELEARWPELSSIIFNYYDTLPKYRRDEVASKIKEFYINNRAINQNTYEHLVKALTDRNFYADIGEFTRLFVLKSTRKAYMYRYSFRGEKSLSDLIGRTNVNYGASHSDDLFRVFLLPNFDLNRSDDMEIINTLIKIIYSFSTTGFFQSAFSKELPMVPSHSRNRN